MTITLYDNAMQVVPLLLVALFLDSRPADDDDESSRARWWARMQDRAFVSLGVVAFLLSMFVVADVLDDSRGTRGVVLAALGGAIGLLFARIWRRFERVHRRPVKPQSEPGNT